MDCPYYREQFTAFLSNSLEQSGRAELQEHLINCNECRIEFNSLQKTWNLMSEIPLPEPSNSMSTGFNAILNNFKEELSRDERPFTAWLRRIKEQWILLPRPNLAFSVVLICIGLSAGYLLSRSGHTSLAYNRQIDSLSLQVSEMKQLMMLSLLQNPSASERIRAVGYTDEINNVDNKVIEALLTTLNQDPNVNVRLITLEALVKLSDHPRVREGLVQSIGLQESPLVQSAIADVMVQLQEKSSVQSLQKLLEKKGLNTMVKRKIEQSIHKLS